jgi:hypothetical protein
MRFAPMSVCLTIKMLQNWGGKMDNWGTFVVDQSGIWGISILNSELLRETRKSLRDMSIRNNIENWLRTFRQAFFEPKSRTQFWMIQQLTNSHLKVRIRTPKRSLKWLKG